MTTHTGFRMGRLDHVHIRVPDRAEAAAWYSEHLGFEPVERFDFWASGFEGGPLQISADDGATSLALFEVSDGHPMVPQQTGVAFSVDADGFAEFVRSLPNGIDGPDGQPLMPADVIDFDMCWAYDLADPWGNQYELNCYEYARVKAELIEADAIAATRYWPRELYLEYTAAHRNPSTTPTGGWSDPDQVAWYTERIGKLEARRAGEQMLLASLPAAPRRMLDLGCGDGGLSALVLDAHDTIDQVVAVDISEPMLERARERFDGDERIDVRRWDLRDSIAMLGEFDIVVSGFAIHHLTDTRKRTLLIEIVDQLTPGGTFSNLEVVASATPQRHAEFLAAIGRTADDAEDQLAPVDEQLTWMRDGGFTNVDCLWRWRGFALLVGDAPLVVGQE